MKSIKVPVVLLSVALVFSSCGTWNNTQKGAAIGVGGGAAVGAGVGALAGNTALGSVIGAAVGGAAGALIGKKMDKQKQELEATLPEETTVETINNGEALKVTFDSGILFKTSSSDLSTSAKSALSKFANNVLNQNPDMDVAIYGYTDNTGWKNSTAEQSVQKNLDLSQARAQSVSSYLLTCGAQSSQIKTVEGLGESNPVADNSTEAGRQENRRVEVYMYASQQMIQQAEAGTLQ